VKLLETYHWPQQEALSVRDGEIRRLTPGIPRDGSLDGSLINIPKINGAGSIYGFTTITIDSTVGGGFADANDVNPVAEPVIPVGTGFFLQNLTAAPVNWVQSY
jgi:hypothetical protein